MTAPELDSPEARQQVRDWLPWYAAGTLTADDREFVEGWLARHGARHPGLVAELAWLQRTGEQWRDLSGARLPAPEAGLSELMARIAAEPAASERGGAAGRLGRWMAQWLAPRPALAFGLVALLAVQAAVIGTLMTREPAAQEPLSGAAGPGTAKDEVLLTVAFGAAATEADIRALLQRAGAQIAGGPSALGLYRVAVPKDRADTALAVLKAGAPTIESVQREP